ncbi:Stp1/IreP family PP2C-type Ser/Thr phosphatase [Apilactobacillus quenuiae]|uniref:Stp1/IreP family PP2C-type Ser/Thr phosphatase n=1 Tax=Apilactobacillus quenuiae TaxID=2008377 RepID=UPI000D016D5A|nr:Stp1/IreP family PP2C-type Ser/Thr phosphatase [Apilactobacillus quenuiae]
MQIIAKSSIGKVRDKNEDCVGYFYNHQGALLTVLADGIGGNRGGDVASKMAVDLLGNAFKKYTISSIKAVENWIQKQFKIINNQIMIKSEEHFSLDKMGTTIVIALFFGNQYLVAHLGDSRCYVLHNNELNQVTVDHSYVNILIKNGELSKKDANDSALKNIIVKGLGVSSDADTNISKINLSTNDIVLLCSDGLTNMVNDLDIYYKLNQNSSVNKIANDLIKEANDNGGNDNISVVIIKNTLGSDNL